MNAPLDLSKLDLERISILRNATAIRSAWTPEERRRRAVSAKRFSTVLSRMIADPEADDDECWAVGAPTGLDLELLERAG